MLKVEYNSKFLLKLKLYPGKEERKQNTLLVCGVISCGRTLIIIDKMTEAIYTSSVDYLHMKVITTF